MLKEAIEKFRNYVRRTCSRPETMISLRTQKVAMPR